MKLFNLLKSNVVETDVMEAVNPKYPKVVQDIHREFMTAGDMLLSQAKAIIDNAKITNEQKVDQLASLGFTSVKEVKVATEIKSKREEQEKIAEAITDFQREFPNNKVITEEIVAKICKKYGLVFGNVSQFKGFVPQKNADDIARFYKNHPDEQFMYIYAMRGYSTFISASKEDYDRQQQHKKDPEYAKIYAAATGSYYQSKAELKICAPVKDMDTTGYSVKGHLLVKDVPDPIVTKEKVHKNGTKCHIILTAWGDEASDPLVVNEQNN